MVVSWHIVHYRTAAPYTEAQSRIITQFALEISTVGSGFIKGTLENSLSPLVLGAMTSYLYDET